MPGQCGVLTSLMRTPCKRPAGAGTRHLGSGPCIDHGGNLPTVEHHHQEKLAQSALLSLGKPLAIHPLQALLSLVHEAAGNVAFYRERASALSEQLLSTDGREREEANRAVRMYNEERDRLAKTAKICHDVGLSERLVTLAEAQSDGIIAITRTIIRSLNLTPAQERAALEVARSEMMRFATMIETGDNVLALPEPKIVDAK